MDRKGSLIDSAYSPILLVDLTATRNTVLKIRFLKENDSHGSNGSFVKACRTTDGSQFGKCFVWAALDRTRALKKIWQPRASKKSLSKNTSKRRPLAPQEYQLSNPYLRHSVRILVLTQSLPRLILWNSTKNCRPSTHLYK